MRNAESCSCGRGLTTVLGKLVCPECSQFPQLCRCWRLGRGKEMSEEQHDLWEHTVQNHGAGDLVDLARAWAEEGVLVPEWFIRLSMKDADWCDEAIEDVATEICELKASDAELHPERVEVNSTTMWTQPPQERGADSTPQTSHDGMKERDMATREPITQFLGTGLWNQAAANLAGKVHQDLADGKLDMTKHEDRMEVLGWTALIFAVENVMVPMGFALRNTLPKLISQAKGEPVETPSQGGKAVNF